MTMQRRSIVSSLTRCAHVVVAKLVPATLEKIAAAASETIHKPIHLIVGGTHLLPAADDEIARVANALHDTWKVQWIAPAHRTGEPAFAILQRTFKDRYVHAGLGSTLVVGPNVVSYDEGVTHRSAQAMGEERQVYRRLLVTGLEEEASALATADP